MTKDFAEIIISSIAALATLSAVLYVLFRDVFNNPKLTMKLELIEGGFDGIKKHYRIIIKNKRKITAKNCIIQVDKIYDFENNISPSLYDPRCLEWRSPEIKPQFMAGDELITVESIQTKSDIFPKGNIKARFIACTTNDDIFINYDVKQTKETYQLVPNDRSINLKQWLHSANSKIILRLVVYAENADAVVSYCTVKKDKNGIVTLNLTSRRPKLKKL